MRKWLRRIALCFAAGSAGSLINTVVIWAGARFPASAGVAAHLARAQYPTGFYVRIVWGGLAAMLFLLPLLPSRWLVRGLFWGILAAALQLVVVPLLVYHGMRLALAPQLSALALSCLWGVATAGLLRLLGD